MHERAVHQSRVDAAGERDGNKAQNRPDLAETDEKKRTGGKYREKRGLSQAQTQGKVDSEDDTLSCVRVYVYVRTCMCALTRVCVCEGAGGHCPHCPH